MEPTTTTSASLEPIKLLISMLALVVSVIALVISQLASRRAKRAEDVKALLGEKESVAFAGLKLLRDGLPGNDRQRKLIIRALVQACIFVGSDRARALLYRVIEENRKKYGREFMEAFERIEETFANMKNYDFSLEQLNLNRGIRRVDALRRVINGTRIQDRNLEK